MTGPADDPTAAWGDPSPQAMARRRALGGALLDALDRLDDDELLSSLLNLWRQADPTASGALFAGITFDDRRAKLAIAKLRDPPPLDAFWASCASEPGPLWSGEFTRLMAAQTMSSPSTTSKGIDEHWARAGRALARSPWSDAIGAALAKSRPESCASWALAAAAAGASLERARAAASHARVRGGDSVEARDALIELACLARDSELFDFATSFSDCGPLSLKAVGDCSLALSRPGPHHRVRESLGLAKSQLSEGSEMVRALLDRFPQPELARAALRAACLAKNCLPEQLAAHGWAEARKHFSRLGASELAVGDLLDLAKAASEAWTRVDGFGSLGGAGGSERQAEMAALAEAAIRRALAPRSATLAHDEAPLEFRLIPMLPTLPPKALSLALGRIDDLSKSGWPKETLRWSRARGAFTETIGTAIADLPRAKKGEASQFEPLMKRWLAALAAQGLDFEAKATPKSRTLGERLRGAQMKEFWSVVEAAAIGASSKAPAKTKRARAL